MGRGVELNAQYVAESFAIEPWFVCRNVAYPPPRSLKTSTYRMVKDSGRGGASVVLVF